METCAAELVIYVPKEGAPQALSDLLMETLSSCGIPYTGPVEAACAAGGTITLCHTEARYGSPYGIGPDDLPAGVDCDLHVAAHWDWEATVIWIRAGIRIDRASASGSPEPLMAEDDLQLLVSGTDGDRPALEARLRSFFTRPAPSYEIGPRRATVDWDREVTEE